jgi:hypothetical protein
MPLRPFVVCTLPPSSRVLFWPKGRRFSAVAQPIKSFSARRLMRSTSWEVP